MSFFGNKIWTDEEINDLIDEISSGKNWINIANDHNRTIGAIESKSF